MCDNLVYTNNYIGRKNSSRMSAIQRARLQVPRNLLHVARAQSRQRLHSTQTRLRQLTPSRRNRTYARRKALPGMRPIPPKELRTGKRILARNRAQNLATILKDEPE